MKVAVYTIALNEAAFVDRYMDALGDADLVLVADTGSTDGTQAALRSRGAVVHDIRVRPWRFDDARNASLALVPDDVDVCLVVDLDEVLSEGWRTDLETEWGDATRGRYLYVFSHRPDGTPDMTYWHDRAHSRFGYRWVYACHEHLVADRIDERYCDLSLEMHQFADRGKPRGHYLPLLEVNALENPDLPRAAHYLGREYTYVQRWADALVHLERHVTMPQSVWGPERAASFRLIAQCHTALGDPDAALDALRRGVDEAPHLREPWVALAQALHDRRDWTGCYHAASRALGIVERPRDYFCEGWAWGARADDLAGIAAWWLGRPDEALTHAVRAAEAESDDERLRANVDFVRAHPTPDA